ncbi:MAG: hypothetical protein CMJ64_19620 [Planctomycetaceae bacterium]|nr:hypothetical protein [Planctomycetaceae bacterium]
MTVTKLDRDTTVGLIAGWGRYPIVIAEALKAQGHRVVCVGIKQHADPSLRDICDVYSEIGLGKLGAAFRFFRKHSASTATMAGKIHKVLIFKRFYWLTHFPDWGGLMTYFPFVFSKTRDWKDDTILGAIVEAFAQRGITFAPATDFLPELLVKTGVLTRRRPTSSELKDIEFGWQLAKEMGRLDVGQSVAVKERAILAVEAVEGTDKCIQRASELCPDGQFTLVKVAKPKQDMRFDVPTIGIGTMETLVEAGACLLAIEADKTILLDEAEAIEFANRHKLCLVALSDAAGELHDAA